MNPNIFREYDVRGAADRDLSDEVVLAIGHALGASYAERGHKRIVVGRDCRLSSQRLRNALVRGLVESGRHVQLIEVGPSPLLYFAVQHLGADGGVMITGSHNPPEDNGFKILRGNDSLFGDDLRSLATRATQGYRVQVAGGFVERVGVSDAYLQFMRGNVHLGDRDVRIVLDGGNGAGGPLGLAAFRLLGVQPDALYCEMDGSFPNHHPDPVVAANLEDLVARVRATGALLGLAYDGDGDRLGVVDATGEVIAGDRLLIAFSRAVLARRPGAAIVGEVKCSQSLYDDVAKRGGRPVMSKVGHSLVKARMKQERALLAGARSGHFFFADRYFGYDDAIYASLRLVELLIDRGCTLGELLADVPPAYATDELRVACPDELKFAVVRRVLAHFKATHAVLEVDGARITFEGGWGLVRASNTEAALVSRYEGDSPARRDEVRAEVEAVVEEALRELL